MDIVRLKCSQLLVNEGQVEGLPTNPRSWTKGDIEKLARSLQETPELFEARPCIVYPYGDKYIVLGGNMRLTAAKTLKYKDVPCIVIPAETTIDKLKEIVIKDNGAFGAWDFDELANKWDDLPLTDWGVPAWEEKHLEETEQEATEDDFDENTDQVETRCQKGDIWKLGEHRLMCGDSTSETDVAELMDGELADMCFTDPPYGIDYSGGRTQVVNTKDYGKIENDDLQGEELGSLICNVFKFNKPEADVYICVSPIMQKPFLDYIASQGQQLDAVIVWDKKAPGLGYMAYRRQCEFILFVKGGAYHKGDKSDIDLWRIGRDDTTTYVHGTQKPVGLSGRAISNSSKKGDIVLDFFGGSGSTLIACEQLGRVCRMMELDTHFCDVIIARWEKLTGKQAVKL